MTRLGIEPRSFGPFVNTPLTILVGRLYMLQLLTREVLHILTHTHSLTHSLIHSLSLSLSLTHTHTHIYIYIYWPTVVKIDSKVSFSIATIPRCRGGHYFFSWNAPLYPWNVPYNAEFYARKHQVPFWSLWYDSTWDWTPVSRTLGEHSTHYSNGPVIYVLQLWTIDILYF